MATEAELPRVVPEGTAGHARFHELLHADTHDHLIVPDPHGDRAYADDIVAVPPEHTHSGFEPAGAVATHLAQVTHGGGGGGTGSGAFVESFSTDPGDVAVGVGDGELMFLAQSRILLVNAHVTSSPVGADIILDPKVDDGSGFVSLFPAAYLPRIVVGSLSTGVAVPVVVPARSRLRVDVNQVGSTTPGAGLGVEVEYETVTAPHKWRNGFAMTGVADNTAITVANSGNVAAGDDAISAAPTLGTGSTLTVVTLSSRRMAKHVGAAAAANYFPVNYPAGRKLTAVSWVGRLETDLTAGSRFMSVHLAGVTGCYVQFTATEKLYLNDSAGVSATTTATVTLGALIRVELLVNHQSGVAEIRYFADGLSDVLTERKSISGANLGTTSDQVLCGRLGGTDAATWHTDALKVGERGWLGQP